MLRGAKTHGGTQDGKITPPRGYAFAALKLPRGRCLLTYTVHLKANSSVFEKNIPAREESAKQLFAPAKE